MAVRIGQGASGPMIVEDAATGAPETVGQLRGEAVIREKSIESLVQDSFEEATFSVAEQADSVDVEEVEIEDLSVDLEERIKKLTKLEDQIEDSRDGLDPAKLRELLAALRGGGEADVEKILEEVAARFGDPTDQYAALDEVLQELGRRRGDRELKKAAKKASDTLWERHSGEIVAGLNASPVARRFAHGDVAQFQALREAYRDQVLKQPTMLESLRQLRERFGDDRLEDRIKFLVAAAGRDLDALVSSVEKARLEQVVGDLSRLQLIGSMRAQAATIVGRMTKRFGGIGGKRDWDLLQDGLELMEDKWIGGQKIEALSGALAARDLEGQIYFVRELNAFFRNIPVKAYGDVDERQRVLDASQEALDHLVESEEDET